MSPAETTQNNGVSEQYNCTIIRKARYLLNHFHLPKKYWAEAINNSVFLSNIITTSSRHKQCPYSLWYKSPPCVEKLRIFGFKVIIEIPQSQKEWKLEPVGAEMVLLCYESENTSSRVLRLAYHKVIISRHDESTAVDEVHSSSDLVGGNFAPEHSNVSHIEVIGTCHPTLISSEVTSKNILPYSHRQDVFATSLNETPRTFKQAIRSPDNKVLLEAIRKEISSMHKLHVRGVVNLHADFKLVGTTWVFLYLGGAQDLNLCYARGKEGIVGYSYADWGNFQDTHRLITGFLGTLDGSPILWKTQKQASVPISTADAE
ncbi:hypothetical protein O181_036011 [Austropuccinia psidii MF-1]|uniref:Integrase catalytic domain-containing protein n=1 Tax=Austropuccinia psidii MF-1 TaxID=1389203 RepID=A0A9Q3D9D7_9BASI|nr:hypothetical protein [Austropuccinia psidii MF-1]